MYHRNKNKNIKKKVGSYNTDKYSNPFFRNKRKRNFKFNLNFSPNIKIVGFIIFLIVFSFLWALFFSDYFDIKKINVEGGGKISVDNIRKYANNQLRAKKFIFFSQKNIFLFDKSDYIDFLNSQHSFAYLDVKKKYPDTLNISYNEKPYEITWAEDGKYYYADKEGEIITEANLLELKEKEYPLIENLSDKKINRNQVSVDQKYIDFTLKIFKSMQEYPEEFIIEKFIIDKEPDTLKLQILNGPQIFFNITLDYKMQLRKLLAIKREKLKNNFNSLKYINLKIGDSVYYQ